MPWIERRSRPILASAKQLQADEEGLAERRERQNADQVSVLVVE